MFKKCSRQTQKLGIIAIMLSFVFFTFSCSNDEKKPSIESSNATVQLTHSEETETLKEDVKIISLYDPISSFLIKARDVGVLDRINVFLAEVVEAHPECFSNSLNPNFQPMDVLAILNLSLPSVDLEAWQESVNNFAENSLIQIAQEAITTAQQVLPYSKLSSICLFPVPKVSNPPQLLFNRDEISPTRLTVPLDSATLLLPCASNINCENTLSQSIARGYSYLYYQDAFQLPVEEMTVLERLIYEGQADMFVLSLFPETVFPWNKVLTIEQEVSAWLSLANYLNDKNVTLRDDMLYGFSDDDLWAGFFVAHRIVELAQSANPDLTLTNFIAASSTEILEQSGYVDFMNSSIEQLEATQQLPN